MQVFSQILLRKSLVFKQLSYCHYRQLLYSGSTNSILKVHTDLYNEHTDPYTCQYNTGSVRILQTQLQQSMSTMCESSVLIKVLASSVAIADKAGDIVRY